MALRRMQVYERAKASFVYDLFWRIADNRIIEARNSEVEFYRNLLRGFRRGDLIFDIGANQGSKTDIFLRLGAKVLAVDPDKSNQTILEEKFLKYRIVKKPVFVVGKAVSDKNGSEVFWVDEPGSGKNTLNEKWVEILRADESKFGRSLDFNHSLTVETVTMEDLINEYGLPFFVKIDVEGHEASVLRALRHPVPYLSFEVNLPEFKEEGLQCVELLKRLNQRGVFNYSQASQMRLAGERWVEADSMQNILMSSSQSSIEVFWKTVA
jgi:FkbM family methyltransferase